MRINRKVNLIFIIASIFLLAHSILPHYHHSNTVCFANKEDCKKANLTCCETHSDTHNNTSLNDCDLKKLVLRQDNSNLDDLASFWTMYPLRSFVLNSPETSISSLAKPYTNNYSPCHYGKSIGQRGPPSILFLI